jgi:2-polyprenyl-3-methyl-5-hydroxy-6-metoxy-1,4-benzoquinol methylase
VNELARRGRRLLATGWHYLKRRSRKLLRPQRFLTEQWDREWISYLNTEDPRPFLRPYYDLQLVGDLRGLPPRAVYSTRLTGGMEPLGIYMPGDRLHGGRVFEVGCGPGWLCKQLGLVAAGVVGIDHSKLALHIARLVSPPTCSYYHTTHLDRLEPLHGRFDAMVCRHFFIHQNYASSVQALKLARRLLRPGGLVGADFFLAGPPRQGFVVYPARGGLSVTHTSAAFLYAVEDIRELAEATGFRVVETWENLPHERRFVLLER